MSCVKIDEAGFATGDWLQEVRPLLDIPRKSPNALNGADAAAEYICMTLAAENEILEIVDRQGCVIGAAPRKCAHGDNRLLHRNLFLPMCVNLMDKSRGIVQK